MERVVKEDGVKIELESHTPKSTELSVPADLIRAIGFGPVLKGYRLLAGLSQSELSRKVPCDQTEVSLLEAGKRNSSDELAVAIIEALELEPEDKLVLKVSLQDSEHDVVKRRIRRVQPGYGSTIRQIRESKAINQAELARLLGYEQSLISKLEKEKRFPSRSFVEALIDNLSIPDDQIQNLRTITGYPEVPKS